MGKCMGHEPELDHSLAFTGIETRSLVAWEIGDTSVSMGALVHESG
jgi:hypothetical protein